MSYGTSLPLPLMTSDPGSFAQATIVERKPQIIRQVIQDNVYPVEIVRALEEFRDEIASRSIQPLRESALDTSTWNDTLAAYAGKTWLEVPWYFAEAFFYRKLLEATRYFQGDAGQGLNPFRKKKQIQMEADVRKLAGEWEQLLALDTQVLFDALLHASLWGNRADLSNFTVKVAAQGGLAAREERHLILIDQTEQVRDTLVGGVQRMDFINDNVGSDLLFDLALSDFLLCRGWAHEIHLQLKQQPFFVSDAMPDDVEETIALLKAEPSQAVSALSARLADDLTSRRLILDTDPFWTSCLMFRQMPTHLKEQLARSSLVLLKGDVNYRRLLDDLHWPPTTYIQDVADYFPAPLAVLRTLKGEIIVGLEPGQAEALQAEDPTWLINGKRGLIQFVPK